MSEPTPTGPASEPEPTPTEPAEPEIEPAETEIEPAEPEIEPAEPEIEPAEPEIEPAESETESEPSPAPRMRCALWRDVSRAAAVALVGCAALALVEYVATIRAYPLDLRLITALRLALLDLTLCTVAWALMTTALGGLAAAARVVLWLHDRDAGRRWAGLFPPYRSFPAARPAVGWLWAIASGAAVYILLSSRLTGWAMRAFKDPQLTAVLLAVLQIGLIAVVAGIAYGAGRGFIAMGRRLDARLGRANPFGHSLPAFALIVVIGYAALRIIQVVLPQVAPLIPWRNLLALVVFIGGAWLGTWILARRRGLLPRGGRRRKLAWGGIAAAALAIVPFTLLRAGADAETKYVAITASPTLARIIDIVRRANDFDGDGFGSLLGENDCAPFDRKIHPGARDIPDNRVDENCDGRDFSFAKPPSYRTGEKLPVPAAWKRSNWNFLLLTIDTVRFDHTGFGGYKKTRGRDTTPNLDDLVERSVSFDFANAPSAGTMASVPAILASKFFHSGIALDLKNIKPGMPPRLAPSNVLISEIMKRAGYTTGAVTTHVYFNDWGMEQGFDTFDNDLGRDRNPKAITAPQVTDRVVGWVARNNRKKWFLWAHYIDPHGHYMPHPDKSFGTSEEDKYDGELFFTDRHIGRLLKELARIPGAERTIVIITSDHGDGFGEHGFINHGQALYRELLHVPLIVYIPNLPSRRVPGAVSPLDIVPTIADLAGIDVKDLSFEGESLVPQLFYGRDAHHRVVFAETNWPRPLRAAITSRYKLVYNLQANLFELYDLRKDPWEKRNIATSGGAPKKQMRGYLEDWLERVYYARDPRTNQAAMDRARFILKKRPTPQHPVQGLVYDGGRIEVLGFDLDKKEYRPGDTIRCSVYFEVEKRPSADYMLQIEARLEKKAELGKWVGRPARSRLRYTGKNGTFPTGRWRPKELIKDVFTIRTPPTWAGGDTLVLGMRLMAKPHRKDQPKGPTHGGDPTLGLLGIFPMSTPEAPARPAPPPGGRPPLAPLRKP